MFFLVKQRHDPQQKSHLDNFPAKFRWDTSHHATQEIHLQKSGFLIAKITGR